MCRFNAAQVVWNESADSANEKIAEYAYAVVKNKQSFHINFIMDVSPDCDCFSNNDIAIVPNIGIAASFDPVALDKACVDMVNSAPQIKGSILDDGNYKAGEDKFGHIHANTDWKVGLKHGEEIGLGTEVYELVVVK